MRLNANACWAKVSASFLEFDSCSGALLSSVQSAFNPLLSVASAGFIKSELRRQKANLSSQAAVSVQTFFLWLLIYLEHVAAL